MRAFHKLKPDETFIFHFRHDFVDTRHSYVPLEPDNRRAHTVAVIVFGGVAYVGCAPCSWKDQFNRKIGYRMALGRAKHLAGQMYDACGHHASDHKYPYNVIIEQLPEEVDRNKKIKWAKEIAEQVVA